MRPFEIAVLVANLLVLSSYVVGRLPPGWFRLVPLAALPLLVVQVTLEGARWQMYPGYVLTAWSVLALLWPRTLPWVLVTGLGGVGCLLATVVFCTVLPVFELPTPTGPYRIGSVIRHLVDPRTEVPSSRHRQPGRELMIQVWYPADVIGPTQYYCSPAQVPFKKEHLSLVRTHASVGVPVAARPGRYPILIFCPSWTGGRQQNTVQAEELASHGFIVVGIDHPHGSDRTVFPDGRVVRTNLGSWMDFDSDEAEEASKRVDENELEVRTADVVFVLDMLEELDRSDATGLFTGRLDPSRVGVFGHSFGGAVAAEACYRDSRFRAGMDLDGCLFGASARNGIDRPFLIMSDDTPPPTPSKLASSQGSSRRYLTFIDQDVQNIRHSLITYGGYLMSIEGVSHTNFCDSPLLSPIKRVSGAGSIDRGRAMKIINAYSLAFFEEFLNGRSQALLEGASPEYPEVRLLEWRRPVSAQPSQAAR